MFKQQNFIVVDQNCLSRPDSGLENTIINEPGTYFVITDFAYMEMIKPDNWETNIERAFRIICKYPEKILLSNSSPILMKKEILTKKPVRLADNLIEQEQTRNFQIVLREFRNNGLSCKLHGIIDKNRQEALPQMNKVLLNHSANLKMLQEFGNHLSMNLSKDILSRGRSKNKGLIFPQDYRPVIDAIIIQAISMLRDVKFSRKEIERFVLKDTCHLRWLCLFSMLGFEWVMDTGLKSLKPDKATNEFIDLDYVLISSFGHGLISMDKRLRRQYMNLRKILPLWFRMADETKLRWVDEHFKAMDDNLQEIPKS